MKLILAIKSLISGAIFNCLLWKVSLYPDFCWVPGFGTRFVEVLCEQETVDCSLLRVVRGRAWGETLSVGAFFVF